MEPHQKHLLVLIDGSERSSRTIAYLTQTPCFRQAEITLYHVFNAIPESYWDLSREPCAIHETVSLRAWEHQQRVEIDAHLENCRQMLLAADFQPQRIHIRVQPRRHGIARDLIAESQKAYTALLLRRRGTSRIPGLTIGSVAHKLVGNLHRVPLILAGRTPSNGRYLVALDGSTGAQRALDFAIDLLTGSEAEFLLLNVQRNGSRRRSQKKAEVSVADLPEAVSIHVQDMLLDARVQLEAAGFDAPHIRSKILTGARSRAGAIVEMAEKADAGTIVIGRKGISQVQEFIMGRVSNKVLHMGRRFNIWMAG